MMWPLLLCAALAAQAPVARASGASSEPPAPRRIAVMKTEVSGGLDPAVGSQLTARLAEAVRQETGAEVISSDEIVALLKHEKEKAILGECKEEESCLAELANALGSEAIVSARLSRVEGGALMSVSLVDAQTAAVRGRVNETWGGEPLLILSLARPAVTKLFATSTIPKGAIEVIGALSGSTIIVDGEVRGSAELPRIPDLLIGAHHVVVQKDGMAPAEAWVIVERDKQSSVPISQRGFEEPFYGTWWFWTAAGAGLAVAGATAAGIAIFLTQGRTGVAVQLNADDSLTRRGLLAAPASAP
jgi:hypothetical protein